jgi:hypothetical protein
MTRLYPIFFGVLFVCGCATVDEPIAATIPTTPISTDSSATQTVAEDQKDIDVSHKESSSTPVAAAPTELESIEPPPVEQSDIPIAAATRTERICTREKRTGSHRAIRVCRTRAEVERLEEEGKDTFRELHRSQSLEQ